MRHETSIIDGPEDQLLTRFDNTSSPNYFIGQIIHVGIAPYRVTDIKIIHHLRGGIHLASEPTETDHIKTYVTVSKDFSTSNFNEVRPDVKRSNKL